MHRMLFTLALALCLAPNALALAPPPQEQWIVVVPSDYETAIAPLVAHRKSQFLRVRLVRVQDHLNFKDHLSGNTAPLRDAVRRLIRTHPGKSSILLVGAVRGSGSGVVPALRGTAGRMTGEPSDAGYGCLDNSRLPVAAVGRFPARNADDVRAMVKKTIALDSDSQPSTWRRRLSILAGIPAYNPVVDRLIESIAFSQFDRIHPSWTGRAIYTSAGSRFFLPPASLTTKARELLADGQLFILYLGHSSAEGLYGGPNTAFLSRDDWSKLRIGRGGSVFITFGCNGCQFGGLDGEGYGLAAIRNPTGPTAVIGSHGICFAAMVHLATNGLFQDAFQGRSPSRLGDCWLAALKGVSRGNIDFLTYRMLDAVDGDPKISQAMQRQEHLEMFALLGDPALHLPQVPRDIWVVAPTSLTPGKDLPIEGRLPSHLKNARVEVELVRSPASIPVGLAAVPANSGPEKDRVLLANYRIANQFVLTSAQAKVEGVRFQTTLRVPQKLPSGKCTIRVIAILGERESLGTWSIEPLIRKNEE